MPPMARDHIDSNASAGLSADGAVVLRDVRDLRLYVFRRLIKSLKRRDRRQIPHPPEAAERRNS